MALLHCVSGYPAPAAEYHLATSFPTCVNAFGVEVASDSLSLGTATAVAATALGATPYRETTSLRCAVDGGPDCALRWSPEELAQLAADTCTAWSAITGALRYSLSASEQHKHPVPTPASIWSRR